MLRVAVVLLLLLCAGVVAGCGGSRQFSPAERAAIRVAQRHDGYLRIFPSRQGGPMSCRIAGPRSTATRPRAALSLCSVRRTES